MLIDDIKAYSILIEPIVNAVGGPEPGGFADLQWDGSDAEWNAMLDDPGVIFQNNRRVFALMRVSEDLRYFAGIKDADGASYIHEVGTFSSIELALNFAELFLVNEFELRGLKSLTMMICDWSEF